MPTRVWPPTPTCSRRRSPRPTVADAADADDDLVADAKLVADADLGFGEAALADIAADADRYEAAADLYADDALHEFAAELDSNPGISDVQLRVAPRDQTPTGAVEGNVRGTDAVDAGWSSAVAAVDAPEPEPAACAGPDAGRAAPATPPGAPPVVEDDAPAPAVPRVFAPAAPRFAPRRSDVSELLAGFVPADTDGDRDLCRDLKALAGMSATPPPVAVVEEGGEPPRRVAGTRSH